ncbi:hypothetical protein GDO81_013289 [Engystomops pustulosus]|uniref:Uncharacterized protein n=1 Tax=Engystomops pustulosus TaxID=76066 RepID=A0AAV7B274_ENGPU|nr:hypothetical protein GDO81_013289 [Engystomops pustulosus]
MSKEERGRETDRQARGCEHDRSKGRREEALESERQRPREADMAVNSFQRNICFKFLSGCLVPAGASETPDGSLGPQVRNGDIIKPMTTFHMRRKASP